MGILKVISSKDKYTGEYINTTSRSTNWSRGLSPFFSGRVKLYGDYVAENVENGWQYSKVYEEFADQEGNPTKEYYDWAEKGFKSTYANRYPMGRGRKPLYSIWDGEKYSYVEARKKIYIPIYAKSVVKTKAYKQLKEMYDRGEDLVLWDFDGYDYEKLGMTLDEVINCPTKKMGHAFVLVMLLTGKVSVSGENVTINKDAPKGIDTYEQQSLF